MSSQIARPDTVLSLLSDPILVLLVTETRRAISNGDPRMYFSHLREVEIDVGSGLTLYSSKEFPDVEFVQLSSYLCLLWKYLKTDYPELNILEHRRDTNTWHLNLEQLTEATKAPDTYIEAFCLSAQRLSDELVKRDD